MDYKQQLKLQAYLDGELSKQEQRHISDLLARDAEAAALFEELRQTREALANAEEGVVLPESREFFWSKIQREIQHQQPSTQPAPAKPLFAAFRKWLRPALAMAMVVLLGVIVTQQVSSPPGHAAVTSLEDAGAFTYHDYKAGVTLVWLSYPAEKVLPGEDEIASVE